MGRRLRVTHADRIAHVMFHTLDDHSFTPRDLRAFKRRLAKLVAKHDLKILYWTFMQNHVHLLFQFSEEKDCGVIVGTIECCLTKVYNGARKRKGSLWRGRYKDATVQTYAYFWNAFVYLGLNKIKAGGVKKLDQDYYSSYLAYTQGRDDGITTLCEEFYELGDNLEACQNEIKRMMRTAYASWRDKKTWERIERGEEVWAAGGRVDMGEVLAMQKRQDSILAKAHLAAKAQKSQGDVAKKLSEARQKAFTRISKRKERLAESLASRGIPLGCSRSSGQKRTSSATLSGAILTGSAWPEPLARACPVSHLQPLSPLPRDRYGLPPIATPKKTHSNTSSTTRNALPSAITSHYT